VSRKLGFDRFHFRVKIDIVLARMRLQLLQTPFQFEDRLFKMSSCSSIALIGNRDWGLVVDELLNSSTSAAARPSPCGGGGWDNAGCAESVME